jgi:hypothetical protein
MLSQRLYAIDNYYPPFANTRTCYILMKSRSKGSKIVRVFCCRGDTKKSTRADAYSISAALLLAQSVSAFLFRSAAFFVSPRMINMGGSLEMPATLGIRTSN